MQPKTIELLPQNLQKIGNYPIGAAAANPRLVSDKEGAGVPREPRKRPSFRGAGFAEARSRADVSIVASKS